MGMKKTTSLKTSFWKFLCMLLIGLMVSTAIPFSLILAGTSTGFITYADYSERSAKKIVPIIVATPDLTDVQLPLGCKYLILDKNYQMREAASRRKLYIMHRSNSSWGIRAEPQICTLVWDYILRATLLSSITDSSY